jgi:hypothetical protein
MQRTLCHDAAEFGKVASRGPLIKAVPWPTRSSGSPMQHQDTLLPGAVYRHKAQHWPLHCFTDDLGCVILLAFPMGPDRDRRNQPQIMTQYLQFARPVMQRCTSRKADQAGTALGAEAHNLATPQLPAWRDSSATADRVPLKNILAMSMLMILPMVDGAPR